MTRQTFVDLAAQPVHNRCTNPSMENAATTGWGISGPATSTVPLPDTTPIRVGHYVLQVTTTGANGGVYTSANSFPGGPHAFAPWVHSPVAQNFTILATQSAPVGGAPSIVGQVVTAVPANVWTRLNPLVGKVPDVETRTNWIVRAAGASVWYLDAGHAMPNPPGGVLPAYGDGSIPGWRWWGAANASESSGWPYTLESIAGTPTVDLLAPAVVPLSGEVTTRGMALYWVADRLTTAGSWADSFCINYGPGTTPTRPTMLGVMSNGGATPNNMQNRLDTSAAAGNGQNQSLVGTTAVGRHVYATTVPDGVGELTLWRDGVVSRKAVVNPQPLERYELRLTAASATSAPVRGVFYDRAHNDDTVKRVGAWLARAHGAPVPVGSRLPRPRPR